MRKKEKFARNCEILNRFVADYPFEGIDDLTNLFMLLTEEKLKREAVIYLKMGKKQRKCFESLVSVKVKKPNMVLTSSSEQPQMPEFILKDGRNKITLFHLPYITNIDIKKEECDSFTRYIANFSHMDFDYGMDIVISHNTN